MIQLTALAVTLLIAILTGGITGLFISFNHLFGVIPNDKLFDDEMFFEVAEDDDAGYR